MPKAGDDLAVLEPVAGQILAGIDPTLDGVHLRLDECGGLAAGRKAANRNLSDVAAMGGMPKALLVSLVLSRATSRRIAQDIIIGIECAAEAAGCNIVGGDFAMWDGPTAITVAVLGEARHPVPRHGAKPGQKLFVTGRLGGSILGRHLTFTPRLAEGQAAAAQGVSAMMDISDGLSTDLPRLLGRFGALLTDVPIHVDAKLLADQDGHLPLWHALHDGEDYELLLAADAMPQDLWCHEIGVVTDEPAIWLDIDGSPVTLESLGFEHGGEAAGIDAKGRGSILVQADPRRWEVTSVEATMQVAQEVATQLAEGGIVTLSGDLGAGKTHFVRGLVSALGGDARDVSSPTYVLLQSYAIGGGRTLHHLDAYRVGGAGDFDEIGFDELLEDAAAGDVVAIEWPERVEEALPVKALCIQIEHAGESVRRITLR